MISQCNFCYFLLSLFFFIAHYENKWTYIDLAAGQEMSLSTKCGDDSEKEEEEENGIKKQAPNSLVSASSSTSTSSSTSSSSFYPPAPVFARRRCKRIRTTFKNSQVKAMRSYFNANQNPDSQQLRQLSSQTELSKRVLQVRKAFLESISVKPHKIGHEQLLTRERKRSKVKSGCVCV